MIKNIVKSRDESNTVVCRNCNEWQPGIAQIEQALIFQATHGVLYVGPIMKFCPWCGEKLKPLKED